MRLLALIPLAVLLGCQTYDFEPVTPILVGQTTDSAVIAGGRLKPNVMILVDRSLSMLRPVDPSDPSCPAGCGSSSATECPAACPTRMSELKRAMGAFLTSSAEVARFGVTQFPTDPLCKPADQVNVRFHGLDDEESRASLLAGAADVNGFIQSITSMGGTPTGASLDFLGDALSNSVRDDFVLLLTDGLPNCNDVNPNALCGCSLGANLCNSAQVASCGCTSTACAGTALCARGCLDRDGVVEKVTRLRKKNLRTIVVGFGADVLTGEGPEVLNAKARAGGFRPTYFQARDAAELSQALAEILTPIQPPCVFRLSAQPSDERYVAVLVEGQTLTQGPQTYTYDLGRNEVTFRGAACERLEHSTALRPVKVEFRIVERF